VGAERRLYHERKKMAQKVKEIASEEIIDEKKILKDAKEKEKEVK